MILQYFKKKENKEQIIATEQYKKILKESNLFLFKNNFFKEKNYKISFEIITIFLIMFIRKNLLENNKKFYQRVNEQLVSLFIYDLDASLRDKGIGDMSIGKYVKSYVKKFYFRLSKFPYETNKIDESHFLDYLQSFELVSSEKKIEAARVFLEVFNNLSDSYKVK